MTNDLTTILYLLSGVLFILAIRGLSSPDTARTGNYLGISGMALAFIVTIINLDQNILINWLLIVSGISIGGLIGTYLSKKVAMTDMPQMVAALNSMGGMSAVLVAWAAFLSPGSFGLLVDGIINTSSIIQMLLGILVGAVTFSGSVIAFLKLQGLMTGAPIILPFRHLINILIFITILGLSASMVIDSSGSHSLFFLVVTILSLSLGLLLIIPIGGADMPVVISMLNSYSGFAAAIIGFTLGNMALVITGALVGSSGAILSYIMCAAMNRSFFSVIMGGFGDEASSTQSNENRPVKIGSSDDAAFILKNASSVIIIPGYGMAVARAQNALKEMSDKLKAMGIKVSYAIHPVAGRMPGHMNVLLAEVDIDYEDMFTLEDINSEFSSTDVVIVLGANDVVNPLARTDENSPIYGMPILDVDLAKQVIVIKRSMSPGYAGIANPLFINDNAKMLFADAKEGLENIIKSFELV